MRYMLVKIKSRIVAYIIKSQIYVKVCNNYYDFVSMCYALVH